jgi:hypothetical protein
MRSIATNTKNRMAANTASYELRQRAEIEARETDKLIEWFDNASADEVLDVDSLPIAENEEYAVKRRYHKAEDGSLAMYVFILHSPSVKVFNDYHNRIGAGLPPAIDAMGILENCYARKIPSGISIDEFIQNDVDIYDATLADHHPGQDFVFGIPVDDAAEIPNSNDVIRKQKPLLNIYKDAVCALGRSNWVISPEIIAIDKKLTLGLNFTEGEALRLDDSRKLLDGVHQYIMSTLNNASTAELDMLSELEDSDYSAAYSVTGHYGGAARDAGLRYESSACPTVINSASANELAGLEQAFRLKQESRKNWEWKRGVCVVKECPSRPSKTDVGPCSVCRKCQDIFDQGKNPKKTYKTIGFFDLLFGGTEKKAA